MKPEDFVGPRMLSHVLAEAERLARRGDRFFLFRQHEYFKQQNTECPDKACGGCAVTSWMLGQLAPMLIGQESMEAPSCGNQRKNARAMWASEKSQRVEKIAKVRSRFREYAAHEDERAANEAQRVSDRERRLTLLRDHHEDERS